MTNYTMKDLPFSLQGKNYGTSSESIHYQINYNNSCVCLKVKEKSLLFFFTLTHTNYLSQRQQHFVLSFIFFFSMHSSFLVVFFISKRLPLGCSHFFLVWLLFHCFRQYAALPCCCSHQFFCGTLLFAFISKSAAPHES